MATTNNTSIIHFPNINNIDWISNNFINSRGVRFVAPVADSVTEFMPVTRFAFKTNKVFKQCLEGEPAIFVCQKIFIDNGVRYGVIDCSIRTVKYTTVPLMLKADTTYNITAGVDGVDTSVTESTTGKLFRIIDQDKINKTITYIDA